MEMRTAEENQLFQKPGSPSKWLISEAKTTSVCQTLPIQTPPKSASKQIKPPQNPQNKQPKPLVDIFFINETKKPEYHLI